MKILNWEAILWDCLEEMKNIPDGSIDLTVTSPPYDNLRTYKWNLQWDFEWIAKELYRVTKQWWVCVWVVWDGHDKNGSETLTSFKQALFFKEIWFNVHDTMIYQKNSYPFPPVNRYYQQFEYMFVFSKWKPKTTNIQTQKTIWQKSSQELSTTRQKDGSTKEMKYEKWKEYRKMDNVWIINTWYMRSTKDKIAYKHPAIFPDELAKRHILSWSNEWDTILDPFAWSFTTAVACENTNRKWICIEKEKEYFDIWINRLLTSPTKSYY